MFCNLGGLRVKCFAIWGLRVNVLQFRVLRVKCFAIWGFKG